ncbi:MAG: tetratricopeptide repeat protein [Melioribacteraceae bacterium]
MITDNNFASNLNTLLSRFLTAEDVLEYLENIAIKFIPPDFRRYPKENLLSKFFTDSVLSKDIRLVSDTLITFADSKLDQEKYVSFLLEFSKLALVQGENDLSYDITMLLIQRIITTNEYKKELASAYLMLAEFYLNQAGWDEATKNLYDAKEIFTALDDKYGMARSEFLLGSMYVEKGDLETGHYRLASSLKIIGEDGDKRLVAMIETNFAIIYSMNRDYEKAIQSYNKALTKFEELNDDRRKAEVLVNIGMSYRKLGQSTTAIDYFEKSHDIAKRYSYFPILKLCYFNKAELLFQIGKLNEATEYSQKALDLSYQMNDKAAIADIHRINGTIARYQKNYVLAESYLLTSLRLNETLNDEINAAETNYELGLLFSDMGDVPKATTHLMKSVKYYQRNKNVGSLPVN